MGAKQVVVGGGVIGLTVAHHLARDGHEVTILDRPAPGRSASWAGAGILPPGNPAFASSPLDWLRADSTSRFADYAAQLAATTGIHSGYQRCGGIEFLTDAEADYMERWQAERIVVEPLGGEWAKRLRVPTGTTPYWLPDFAQVRNPWHLRALAAACEQLGVKQITGSASGFETHGNRVTGVRLESGPPCPADGVVVAAGPWANRLLEPLGFPDVVRPVRGQIVLFGPSTLAGGPVLLVGKRYLVPRAEGRVLIGSTEEPEAGFENVTTESAYLELTEFARNLVPLLREVPVEASWAGLRPGSPDGVPTIGPVPGWENVIVAVGHGRAGVQLSLGTAELVRKWVRGTPQIIPLDPFAVGRVWSEPGPSAFRS